MEAVLILKKLKSYDIDILTSIEKDQKSIFFSLLKFSNNRFILECSIRNEVRWSTLIKVSKYQH